MPTKPIEFVVMADQGGGADKITRLIVDIIKKHRLLPVETKVMNMPGGSGADALTFLKAQTSNDHLLLFTLNSFFTVPLTRPDLGIDVLAFTPIARLGLDPFLLWVNTGRTDIDSVHDFVLAVREADNWTMAGTGSLTEDELLTIFLNHVYKIDMKYRPLAGGGEVARQLVEGMANSTLNNPDEIRSYHMARRAKPLAAFTRERLPQYASTPTFWELGLKFEYFMQRAVAGPSGMSREAANFYSALFAKVFDTPEWEIYRERVGLVGPFVMGEELGQYWRNELELHRRMLEIARMIREPGEVRK